MWWVHGNCLRSAETFLLPRQGELNPIRGFHRSVRRSLIQHQLGSISIPLNPARSIWIRRLEQGRGTYAQHERQTKRLGLHAQPALADRRVDVVPELEIGNDREVDPASNKHARIGVEEPFPANADDHENWPARPPDTKEPTQDVGFFVTESGKTIVFERPRGSADFVAPSEPVRVFQAVLVFDPHYGITDGDPGSPLPDNVIERVTPRFFW